MRIWRCFNTQPPEGGWDVFNALEAHSIVSTHSRPKAAGHGRRGDARLKIVSTHSRPKAAGCVSYAGNTADVVFQHTAARRRLDCRLAARCRSLKVSTHSRPKAAGKVLIAIYISIKVSTHSRPKAAGTNRQPIRPRRICFNTQPPEGGWGYATRIPRHRSSFNTQPPEGGWHV